jgi:cell wall-associated NlpC family hydrolase
MEDLLKRALEAVAAAESALGLDWRQSFSRASTVGPGHFEVELSRGEVLRALPGYLENVPGGSFSGETGVLTSQDAAVRFHLLEPQPGRRLWTVSSVADVRREPAHAAELLSQLIMGEAAEALKTEGDWFLARLPDEYHGWIRSWYVSDVTRHEIDNYAAAASSLVTTNVAYVLSTPDEKSLPVSDIVAGTRVAAGETAGDFREVTLPGGKQGFMRSRDLAPAERSAQNVSPDRLAERALKFLGIPYLWGGTTPKGFDCSGLVKRVFLMEGISLPRDSDQQAKVGTSIPKERLEDMAVGDLLFFGEGGKVSHVALHLGGGRFVHAYGEVKINSLAKDDPAYDEKLARSFLFGRRIAAARA